MKLVGIANSNTEIKKIVSSPSNPISLNGVQIKDPKA